MKIRKNWRKRTGQGLIKIPSDGMKEIIVCYALLSILMVAMWIAGII